MLAKEENIYAQKHLNKKQIRRVISKKIIMLLTCIFFKKHLNKKLFCLQMTLPLPCTLPDPQLPPSPPGGSSVRSNHCRFVHPALSHCPSPMIFLRQSWGSGCANTPGLSPTLCLGQLPDPPLAAPPPAGWAGAFLSASFLASLASFSTSCSFFSNTSNLDRDTTLSCK